MKKLAMLALSAAVMASAAVLSSASAITAEQAKTKAEKAVPSGSTYLSVESDDGRFEVKFYSSTWKERYEVDVSKSSAAVVSFESKKDLHSGSNNVKLTEADAKAVVLGEFKDAEIISVLLDTDDGLKEYDVRFKTDKYYGDYTINPESGQILEREIRVGTSPSTADTSSLISFDKAIEIAKNQISGATVTDVDLDREGGSWFYEIELYKDGVEYEIGLNAADGTVLWNAQDNWDDGKKIASNTGSTTGKGKDTAITPSTPSTTSSTYIGVDRAKSIALAKVPGAYVRECKLDREDGRMVYEGELYKDGWEYEFCIDAVTGSIVEWEQDYDD